jgi:hypothetical protein
MFMVEIDGVNVLYTGDYSVYADRHLMGAEVPNISPDVLIVESTFGTQEMAPADEREQRFTSTVLDKILLFVYHNHQDPPLTPSLPPPITIIRWRTLWLSSAGAA